MIKYGNMGGGTPLTQSTQIWQKEANANRLSLSSLSFDAIAGGGTQNRIPSRKTLTRGSETE